MNGYPGAVPREAKGHGDPFHLRLGAVGMGVEPMIDVHNPRGRPALSRKTAPPTKKGEGIKAPRAGDPQDPWAAARGPFQALKAKAVGTR